MPEPITFEALEALGFTIHRDTDGYVECEVAMLRINKHLGLSFYDGVVRLDAGGDDVCEFPNDMIHVRLAMQLFGVPEPKRKQGVSTGCSSAGTTATFSVVATEPRGVGRPKKVPGELKNVDLRIPVTEAQHATVRAAAGDMGIAEWARRILLSAAQ